MSEELHERVHPPDVPATVIHHPEDDETVLARWLRLAVEKGPLFWLPVAGLLVVIIGLAVFSGGVSSGESADAQVWADMILSKSAEDQQKLAEEHSDSRASGWAFLHAAQARYAEGFQDLPNNREAALPLLRQSIDLFQKAEAEAPKDSPLKRIAALGIARAMESRNELEDAVKQYEMVAKSFPDTEESILSTARAKELKEPDFIAFYKDFYAFKPSAITLPPSGRGSFDFPFDHPPMNGPTIKAPGLPPVFTPDMLNPPGEKTTAPGGGEFPKSVFENNPPPAPKPEAPKAEIEPTPKPSPAPAKPPELPVSPFPSTP